MSRALIDFAHSTSAKWGNDFVGTEARAGGEGHDRREYTLAVTMSTLKARDGGQRRPGFEVTSARSPEENPMIRRASRHAALVALSAAALLLGLSATGAQAPQAGDHTAHLKAWDAHKAMTQSSPYRTMNWSFVGPTNISGRISDVAVADRGTSRRLYAGSCCGGVWASDDLGQTWQPVFDQEASTAVGALAVAPSNPDIVWVGTGESNIFRSSYTGVGVYKSTDNAKTFQHMGLIDTGTIGRIVIHPTNPNIVYVASAGQEWMENEMRGVYKTTDGGKTWTHSLKISPKTGAVDLAIDPKDPNTFYAAAWQRQRRKWNDPRVEPGFERERRLQDHRRRQDVDAADQRPAGAERDGPNRPGRRGIESERRLRLLRQLRRAITSGRGSQARQRRDGRTRRESGRERGELSDQRQRGLSIERQGRELDAGQRPDRRAARVHERNVEHVRLGLRQHPRRSD